MLDAGGLVGWREPLAGDQLAVVLDELPALGVFEHVALGAISELSRADLAKFVLHARHPLRREWRNYWQSNAGAGIC